WHAVNGSLPLGAREVGALAVLGDRLALGSESLGLWLSSDAGAHWTQSGLAVNDVASVTFLDDAGSLLLAGAIDPFDEVGMWRSLAGGATWIRADAGIAGLVIASFAVERKGSSRRVFAGAVGRNDGLAGRCVLASDDDGATWQLLGPSLQPGTFDDQHCFVAVDPARPGTVYLARRVFAGVPQVLRTRVWKSLDDGAHWHSLPGPGGYPIAVGERNEVWTNAGWSADGG